MSQGLSCALSTSPLMTVSRITHLLASALLLLGGVPVFGQDVPVTVRPLGDLLVAREVRAPATVISANRAEITSEVAALVREVFKDVGDQVARGDLLIRLDDANASYKLAQAKATLAAIDAQIVEARSRLRKAEELLGKNFISDEELISRRSNLAVLEANLAAQQVAVEAAELELRRTRIVAPYDAAVVARQAQVGSYAQPGTPLITVVQTSHREIDVDLDPRYAVFRPDVTDLRFVSQGRDWPVKLARVSSVIDSASRVVKARFVFTGDVAPIGASGELAWDESSALVPVEYIVQRGRQFGVFVANSHRAHFVAIPTAQEGRPATVDLPADTLIVVRGQARLQDGDALNISRE